MGLLQINFTGNVTLVDHIQPLGERATYLSAAKSVHIITSQNSKFNVMEFDPEHLGKDAYECDASIMSTALHKKLEVYIEYLFEKHEDSWRGKTAEMGDFLVRQLRD